MQTSGQRKQPKVGAIHGESKLLGVAFSFAMSHSETPNLGHVAAPRLAHRRSFSFRSKVDREIPSTRDASALLPPTRRRIS